CNKDELGYSYQQLGGNGNIYTSNSDNSNIVVGDISLQQKFTPNWMGYATYARGYAPKVSNTGIYGGATAAKAPTEGLEIDSVYAAAQLLRISLDLAIINAEFVDYQQAPCWGNGVTQTPALGCNPVPGTSSTSQNVSGEPMPDAPRFKGTLFAEQRLPLGDSGFEGVLGGNYAYRSKTQFQPDQNPETIQGSFGILNLSVGLRPKSGKWSVMAFSNNVTNHHYYVDMEDF